MIATCSWAWRMSPPGMRLRIDSGQIVRWPAVRPVADMKGALAWRFRRLISRRLVGTRADQSHPHQVREACGLHLRHHVGAVDFDGSRTDVVIEGDRLVGMARHEAPQHLAPPRPPLSGGGGAGSLSAMPARSASRLALAP